ncbi:S8/S53 family peptidase [uncultured Kordia sp.]|uniref:S8 family peptidase n=1 Tax=uncultured Kordia sp. TaxID=507699 RepID=UPI00262507C4|nr:S8/S53 family peptidase [uncultured Kordia sp.]
MRNIQKLIAFVLVLLACSCTKDDFIETSNDNVESGIIPKAGSSSYLPNYSNTSIVVQFKSGTSDPQKGAIRTFNGVANYEKCHCTNKDIELWHFGGALYVEPKKRAIKGQIDPESTTGLQEVDYQFTFGFDIGSDYIGTADDVSYLPYIKSSTSGPVGITIAVVDTGIAPGLTVFNTVAEDPIKFLYESGDTAVADEMSGWDFVDEDPNTFDDDTGKHGSIISKQIFSALRNHGVPFRILPIKVAGPSGETTYFDFLCGSLYAMERAELVNISMGWYDTGEYPEVRTIFENITGTHSNTIIVTSAGNNTNNNDDVKHFPSSFENPNIVAVASANGSHDEISDFSNYGAIGVDFFAQGENIPFYEMEVQGTSFAAPQVTIQIANLINDPEVDIFTVDGILMVATLFDQLAARGTHVSGVFTLGDRNTYYNKLIIPFD